MGYHPTQDRASQRYRKRSDLVRVEVHRSTRERLKEFAGKIMTYDGAVNILLDYYEQDH